MATVLNPMSEVNNADKQKRDVDGTEGDEEGGGAKGESAIIVVDDDDTIDDEQLEEYREMVDQLGSFPDKVKINSLSMVAEDHAESKRSATAIYQCIRKPLIDSDIPRDRKLPLVYVIDSILKNVKGNFIPLIEADAKAWMPVVHDAFPEEQRQKLKRVWNTWRDFGLFKEESWREIGRCFTISDAQVNSSRLGMASVAMKDVAGIPRSEDGTLQLPKVLRKEMQLILDEVQSTVTDELEKVSLERLAEIDPDLLAKIKTMAENTVNSGQRSTDRAGRRDDNAQDNHGSLPTPAFFAEIRSPEVLARSQDWAKVKLNHVEQSHDLIAKLNHYVIAGASTSMLYSQREAIQMTSVLAAASATAAHLTNSLQRLKDLEESKTGKTQGAAKTTFGTVADPSVRRFLVVDKSLFTNEGVKKKNDMAIGALYDVGLPFVSSADGRRFATQIELSNHLDYLFRKNQLEKSMERTEERGWYVAMSVWTRESAAAEAPAAGADSSTVLAAEQPGAEEDADPSTYTVPADESRDRCVVCGINFKMFFDHDDGIYKYSNCREIEVLNDDAAEKESESVLVHVTCWRGLGSPDVLTMDQALQETMTRTL